MKSESGRLIPLAKDEKMRAENGRIKGDLNQREAVRVEYRRPYSQLPKRRDAQVLSY